MRGLRHFGAELSVDLSAIKWNYQYLIKNLRKGTELAAVVKADAYGLGVNQIVPALARAGCNTFFVSTLDEGIVLRALVQGATIYVLNGPLADQVPEFITNQLCPVLNSLEQVEHWHNGPDRNSHPELSVALHVDTGMNRYGVSTRELEGLVLGQYNNLSVSLLMSHLACADEPLNPLNHLQLSRFNDCVAWWKTNVSNQITVSFANSSGIFLGPDFQFDLVRAGAALYGINPTPSKSNQMSEVLHLKAQILQVRCVDSPMTVGYGAAHRIKGPTRIATVPVGYADGYIRSLGGRGRAFIGDLSVPVVGRVSMDAITLDVSGVPEEVARPGAVVDLIGGLRPIDDVAEDGGTISYEMLTRISTRIPRRYLCDLEH